MTRTLLVLWLTMALIHPAMAATEPSSSPNPDSEPLHQKAISEAGADCPVRPPPAEGTPSYMAVELDPDTLWRPRGAEVRFTIKGPSGKIDVKKVRVCFGWARPDAIPDPVNALMGSPQVRSISNDTGVTEYGAVVPRLREVGSHNWWPWRMFVAGHYVSTGVYTVPVADMIVEVTTAESPPQVVVTSVQVGVTMAAVAWLVVVVVALLLWAVVNRIAKYRHIRGRNLLLRVISTRDGYASLSQLQIVLWTFVVAMSAIYVMTLSGNLISISSGTLVLLGIASGAALAARVPSAPPAAAPPAGAAGAAPAVPPPGPAGPPATPVVITPEWADLVMSDRTAGEIDVTRLQMFAFTLITAAFVLIKVVVDYEIPEIPANFLVLMGISNGVYVTGRSLPSKPRDAGK